MPKTRRAGRKNQLRRLVAELVCPGHEKRISEVKTVVKSPESNLQQPPTSTSSPAASVSPAIPWRLIPITFDDTTSPVIATPPEDNRYNSPAPPSVSQLNNYYTAEYLETHAINYQLINRAGSDK